jgi:hypothetical protein
MEPETQVTEEPIVEPAVVENALESAVEAPVTEVTEPEPQEEPTETVVEEPKEHGNKGKKPWYMKEIDDLRLQRSQERERAENLQALLERVGKEPATEQPKAPETDIDRLVAERAAKLQMASDRQALIDAGNAAFGIDAFNQAASVAASAGCVSDDFVGDVLAVDRTNAHEIYMKLAQDPEKAFSLGRMDPRRRIAELTRMADAITKEKTTTSALAPKAPAPKQVSKAPAPPPPIEPSATKTKDWRADDSSEDDFQRGWEETMKRRSVRR